MQAVDDNHEIGDRQVNQSNCLILVKINAMQKISNKVFLSVSGFLLVTVCLLYSCNNNAPATATDNNTVSADTVMKMKTDSLKMSTDTMKTDTSGRGGQVPPPVH